MTRSTPPNLRALPLALVAAACSWPVAALAQSAPAPVAPPAIDSDNGNGGAIRLSDAQRDAILDASTEDRAAAARGEPAGAQGPDRRIHGEMGVMIGTNGTRGTYGTADIPLGENAGATVSFETSRFGYPRARRADRRQ
ncbi:hypothetical protein [Sphingomonas colocasiae]|uniref:Uncharacterized protein n=1 Tax=Sphingomonas colocasiae TaxID=1848973 RepID=A0ABS7PWD4_9SPHN|nr:hypothetical protein [Sphingomonas colocasiae]MBY8824955.1 hypothetical protein [Sphingomonas colocasiae]